MGIATVIGAFIFSGILILIVSVIQWIQEYIEECHAEQDRQRAEEDKEQAALIEKITGHPFPETNNFYDSDSQDIGGRDHIDWTKVEQSRSHEDYMDGDIPYYPDDDSYHGDGGGY